MPFVSVDMTNVKSTFEPIAEGKHVFRLIPDAEIKSDKGGNFINWPCIVQEGPDTGKKAWIKTYHENEDCLWVLKSLIESIIHDKIVGQLTINDPAEYYGIDFCAEVTHYRPDPEGTPDKVYANLGKFTEYHG